MEEFNNETRREERRAQWIGYELWEIAKVLLVSLAIAAAVRYFIAQPFIVRGASMEPNFEDRQYLIVDEISYILRNPKRGEPIVFHYPRDTSKFFIKRVVGLPGEKIEIKNGRVHIANKEYPDGFTLEESYLSPPNRATRPDTQVLLKNDEYFVLGDNRDSSSDSRVWGEVRREFLVGRVIFRVWPLGKMGVIPDFSSSY